MTRPAVERRTFRISYEAAAAAAIVAVALVLRLFNIDSVPLSLHADEMAGYTGVRDVLAGKMPAIAFFDDRVMYLPLMGVLQFVSVACFGNTTTALRLPAALLGAATAVAAGLLAYQLAKDRLAGFAAAATMAVLPWDVNISRVGWEPATMFPCLLLGLFFVRRGLDRASAADQRWGFGLLALGAYSYRAEIVDATVLAAAMLAFDARRALAQRRSLLEALGVALLVTLPLFASLFFHREFFGADHAYWTFADGVNAGSVRTFLGLYQMHFAWQSLFVEGDGNLQHGPHHGVLYWWMLPLMLAGVWRAARDLEPRTRWFLLVWLLLFPLGGSLTDEGRAHYLRTVIGAPLACVLAGFGAAVAWRAAARLSALRRRAVLAAFGAVVVFELASYCRAYFVDYPDASAKIFQYGDREIFAIVRAHIGEAERVCFAALDGWNYTVILAYYFPDAPIQAIEGTPDDCKKPRTLLVVDPAFERGRDPVVATVQNRDGTTRAYVLER